MSRYYEDATSVSLEFMLQKHHQSYDGAQCRVVNTTDISSPDWVNFEPSRGEATSPAKFVCQQCIHEDRCLENAMDSGESALIWGGASGRDRKRLREAYENELGAGTISLDMTIGEFSVFAREYFVIEPKPTDKKSSYPPKVMKDARCLTTEHEVFETLDTTHYADLSADLLATAVAACVVCPNQGATCEGVQVSSTSGVSVVNASIVGKPPKKVIPTKKLIRLKVAELKQEVVATPAEEQEDAA